MTGIENSEFYQQSDGTFMRGKPQEIPFNGANIEYSVRKDEVYGKVYIKIEKVSPDNKRGAINRG